MHLNRLLSALCLTAACQPPLVTTSDAAPGADAAPEAACPPASPASPSDCPSCLAGRWRVYGNAGVSLQSPFPLEIAGCLDALTCRVAGTERRCFLQGGGIRLYLDGVGYDQLVFGNLTCDRLTGSHLTYGGATALRAEHEDRPALSEPAGCPSPHAGARRALCGPCGARLEVTDAGTEACERLTNACGGCDPGLPAPGAGCGAGHYYVCAGPDSVSCTVGDRTNLNACGGRSGPLPHAPGEPCGGGSECRYVCEGSSGVTCVCPDADAGR